MQYRLFTIPCYDGEAELEELNRFLRSVKVLQVERQFFSQDRVWQMMVEYQEGADGGSSAVRGGQKKVRIDYREVLEPDQFALFDRLRSWRKEQAEVEKIPAYVIFTNEQLAAVTRLDKVGYAALESIDGIGKARLEKYGAQILEIWQNQTEGAYNEAVVDNGAASR
ncbi:MAG: HRDC domain-containing protein [Pseudomonadota bacterium]|nr:HRDC domain-containing protein [Pseudomonadota bacterium]